MVSSIYEEAMQTGANIEQQAGYPIGASLNMQIKEAYTQNQRGANLSQNTGSSYGGQSHSMVKEEPVSKLMCLYFLE